MNFDQFLKDFLDKLRILWFNNHTQNTWNDFLEKILTNGIIIQNVNLAWEQGKSSDDLAEFTFNQIFKTTTVYCLYKLGNFEKRTVKKDWDKKLFQNMFKGTKDNPLIDVLVKE